MEEGEVTAENSTPPVAVPDAGVAGDTDQHAEGPTVPMAVPEKAVVTERHAEGVMAPMVVQEEAVDAEQRAEGSTAAPMSVPEEAAGVDQHAEGLTVPMVVPEESVGVDQHVEASTVSMVVVTEEAGDEDKHVEGSTVSMVVVTEEAGHADQHVDGSTMSMVVTEEAVDTEQHAEGSTVSMVVTEEAADADQHVEAAAAPMMVPEAAADADHHIEDATTQDKHGDKDGVINVTPEEMRGIIEVIAETGKFWHEWSFLKRLLSLQLMQVLGEYAEAQMVIREDGQKQNSLSADTHSELFSQLNDALMRFEEGPPFTLQRLCEILLDPKGTYKKLSKLAWALEKTLLVTTTITKCTTDPYPAAHGGPKPDATAITDPVDAEPERLPRELPAAISNGTQHAGGDGDGDEEMADAEAPDAQNDVEMQEEEKPDHHTAGVNYSSTAPGAAAVACETAVGASEQSPDPQS